MRHWTFNTQSHNNQRIHAGWKAAGEGQRAHLLRLCSSLPRDPSRGTSTTVYAETVVKSGT